MKKQLLAMGLLVLAGAAQAQQSSVCRLNIGDEWVPMGASELQSCLKYAEAAATPGEPQYAEFGSLSFSYQDGRYSQSLDGGKTWQKFYPRAAGAQIGALNVLREGPSEPAKPEESPEKTAKKAAKAAEKAKTEAAAAAKAQEKADRQAKKKAAATDSAESGYTRPKVPVEPALPDVVTPTPEPTLVPDTATATAKGSAPQQPRQRTRRPNSAVTSAPSGASPGPHDCQIKLDSGWRNVITPSLEACGKLLAKQSSANKQSGGQAYWDGLYLLYHRNVLYQSADGRNWHPL